MRLYGYVIPPMDFGWEHLPTVGEYVAQLAHDAMGEEGNDYAGGPLIYETVRELIALECGANNVADKLGYLGAERRKGKEGETHVMVLPPIPGDPDAALALVWKLDNNGDTVVISTVPLDYLLSPDTVAHYQPPAVAPVAVVK